jgi:large subunit ribosomal protein L15
MLIYAPDHFGRKGFKRPQRAIEYPVAVNVGELPDLVPLLKEKGLFTSEGGHNVADLTGAGIDRLLGGGRVEGKWKVKVSHASRIAREKVEIAE